MIRGRKDYVEWTQYIDHSTFLTSRLREKFFFDPKLHAETCNLSFSDENLRSLAFDGFSQEAVEAERKKCLARTPKGPYESEQIIDYRHERNPKLEAKDFVFDLPRGAKLVENVADAPGASE